MKKFTYPGGSRVVSKETSDQIREALGKVVSEGTGKNAGVEGYEVGSQDRNQSETSQRKR